MGFILTSMTAVLNTVLKQMLKFKYASSPIQIKGTTHMFIIRSMQKCCSGPGACAHISVGFVLYVNKLLRDTHLMKKWYLSSLSLKLLN